jgi:hypothetical protein
MSDDVDSGSDANTTRILYSTNCLHVSYLTLPNKRSLIDNKHGYIIHTWKLTKKYLIMFLYISDNTQ